MWCEYPVLSVHRPHPCHVPLPRALCPCSLPLPACPDPQAFKQPFTAVLCAPGVIGPSSSGSNGSSSSSGVAALLSRSNRQLRAHLAAYGCEGVVAGQLEQQAAAAAAAAAAAQQQQPQRKQQQQQPQLVSGVWRGQP